MSEKEPLYFKKFREQLDVKLETHEPHYFREFKKEFNDFVIITANSFASIEKRMATKDDLEELRNEMKGDLEELRSEINEDLGRAKLELKGDIKEIQAHIGRYEMRAQNTHEIVTQDHKPRLLDLEKKVFA